MVHELLRSVKFRVKRFREEDGSVTLGLDELELYANGGTEKETFEELAYKTI